MSSDLQFKYKYLKYKTKYIQLKNQYGSGRAENIKKITDILTPNRELLNLFQLILNMWSELPNIIPMLINGIEKKYNLPGVKYDEKVKNYFRYLNINIQHIQTNHENELIIPDHFFYGFIINLMNKPGSIDIDKFLLMIKFFDKEEKQISRGDKDLKKKQIKIFNATILKIHSDSNPKAGSKPKAARKESSPGAGGKPEKPVDLKKLSNEQKIDLINSKSYLEYKYFPFNNKFKQNLLLNPSNLINILKELEDNKFYFCEVIYRLDKLVLIMNVKFRENIDIRLKNNTSKLEKTFNELRETIRLQRLPIFLLNPRFSIREFADNVLSESFDNHSIINFETMDKFDSFKRLIIQLILEYLRQRYRDIKIVNMINETCLYFFNSTIIEPNITEKPIIDLINNRKDYINLLIKEGVEYIPYYDSINESGLWRLNIKETLTEERKKYLKPDSSYYHIFQHFIDDSFHNLIKSKQTSFGDINSLTVEEFFDKLFDIAISENTFVFSMDNHCKINIILFNSLKIVFRLEFRKEKITIQLVTMFVNKPLPPLQKVNVSEIETRYKEICKLDSDRTNISTFNIFKSLNEKSNLKEATSYYKSL